MSGRSRAALIPTTAEPYGSGQSVGAGIVSADKAVRAALAAAGKPCGSTQLRRELSPYERLLPWLN